MPHTVAIAGIHRRGNPAALWGRPHTRGPVVMSAAGGGGNAVSTRNGQRWLRPRGYPSSEPKCVRVSRRHAGNECSKSEEGGSSAVMKTGQPKKNSRKEDVVRICRRHSIRVFMATASTRRYRSGGWACGGPPACGSRCNGTRHVGPMRVQRVI